MVTSRLARFTESNGVQYIYRKSPWQWRGDRLQSQFPTVISSRLDSGARPEVPKQCHRRSSPRPVYQVATSLTLDLYLTTITLTAVALLTGRSWFQKIRRLLSGGIPSGTHATVAVTRLSPTLPREIVEVIVGYLIHDVPSLRAFSETCRSWYISAFPHLHLTLFVNVNCLDLKFQWPNPIQSMHTLGLLPSVKNVQIHSGYLGNQFSPSLLESRVLRHFSALTSVQELEIHKLDVPKFLQKIQECFCHFLPTVRSLSLKAPEGSSRQIVCFIGSFQNLEDLSLHDINDSYYGSAGEALIPSFTPPLRGRLTIWHVNRNSIAKDMINLFKGIRFSSMDVFATTTVPILLYACAKTLRGFRLYANDHSGKQHRLKYTQRPADNFCR